MVGLSHRFPHRTSYLLSKCARMNGMVAFRCYTIASDRRHAVKNGRTSWSAPAHPPVSPYAVPFYFSDARARYQENDQFVPAVAVLCRASELRSFSAAAEK